MSAGGRSKGDFDEVGKAMQAAPAITQSNGAQRAMIERSGEDLRGADGIFRREHDERFAFAFANDGAEAFVAGPRIGFGVQIRADQFEVGVDSIGIAMADRHLVWFVLAENVVEGRQGLSQSRNDDIGVSRDAFEGHFGDFERSCGIQAGDEGEHDGRSFVFGGAEEHQDLFAMGAFIAQNAFGGMQVGMRQGGKPHRVNVPIANVIDIRQLPANRIEQFILIIGIGAQVGGTLGGIGSCGQGVRRIWVDKFRDNVCRSFRDLKTMVRLVHTPRVKVTVS